MVAATRAETRLSEGSGPDLTQDTNEVILFVERGFKEDCEGKSSRRGPGDDDLLFCIMKERMKRSFSPQG